MTYAGSIFQMLTCINRIGMAGTINPDEINMNDDQLPLDVQAWAVLALPEVLSIHPDLLTCPETHHQTSSAGFTGFDFNNDKDGVWFEGTAQMATAYAFANNPVSASFFVLCLRELK